MNGATLLLILAGFVAFGAGAWLSATGDRTVGIVLMAAGLAFQVLSLARLKRSKKKDANDAG